MKIHVLSDLHTEFGPVEIPPTDADVVVLAGDIAVGTKGLDWIRSTFPDRRVAYLAGNHEYYGHAIPKLTEELRERAEQVGISFLENSTLTVGDTRLLGCTLWTDFELFGGQERLGGMRAAQDSLTDYRRIRRSPEFRKLQPGDTAALHAGSLKWLEAELAKPFGGKTVVVTHHAPSLRSVAPGYQGDPLSAAFASSMDDLVRNCGAALWIHGHTHYCVDYPIGGIRVLSNQRGYPFELAAGYRPDLVVEV